MPSPIKKQPTRESAMPGLSVCLYFLKRKLMGWAMRCPPQLVKKKMTHHSRQHMMCRPGNQKSGHCDGRKNLVFVFSPKISFSIYFDLKNLENILEILLNQSMATQKPINRLKTWNPPEIKIARKNNFFEQLLIMRTNS